MEKPEEEKKEEKPEYKLPTATQTVNRIRDEVFLHGEEFRRNHPELVERLAVLLSGVHRGTEIFIENKGREYNMDDVRSCLDGLGYEVHASHLYVNNPFGPFRIVWWPDNKTNPFLG